MSRSALALVCVLAACGARANDYAAAIGHNLRDVRVVLRDGSPAFVAGRLKEDAPLGLAGRVPFEGRWLPFIAELDEHGRVRWIRRFAENDDVPAMRFGRYGQRWLIVDEGNHEKIERMETEYLRLPNGCTDCD